LKINPINTLEQEDFNSTSKFYLKSSLWGNICKSNKKHRNKNERKHPKKIKEFDEEKNKEKITLNF
jgi:hypothetical protein